MLDQSSEIMSLFVAAQSEAASLRVGSDEYLALLATLAAVRETEILLDTGTFFDVSASSAVSWKLLMRAEREPLFPVRSDSQVLADTIQEISDDSLKIARSVRRYSTVPSRGSVRRRWTVITAPDSDPNRDTKSPWADAIGPLYTLKTLWRELGYLPKNVRSSVDCGALIGIRTAEGELLIPAHQFQKNGTPVPGLRWVTSQLGEVLDQYTFAAWMNAGHEDLGGLTPWSELQGTAGASERLQRIVVSLRDRLTQ